MNTTVFAVKTTPDSDVENISIFPVYGVLEGESRQMQATVDANGSFFDSVEWSSSNPKAISCTEDGKITGLIAGESATITCKAKWGSVKDTIKVYCAERILSSVKCTPDKLFTFIYAQPSSGKLSGTIVSLPQFFAILSRVFYLISIPMNFNDAVAFFSKLTVYGRIKNYAYVRYGESEIFDGFVKYSSLPIKVNGFLDLSADNMAVWANDITYANRKLTTTYNGKVKWDISNDDYISFDENTGQITGKTAGAGKKVTITARADGMTDTCIIHLLYKWPQAWTTKTNKNTYIYVAEGNEYKTNKYLSAGSVFVVQGDCGTSSGWAYGYYSVGETQHWGYIPIADVSTKGTVSQYNLMNFRWPVNDVTIKKISSPFGSRSADNGGNHKGFDIVSDVSGEVEGKPVVASYKGTIKTIYIDNDKKTSHGNAIVITTDKIDPISGKNLTVIYMHLSRWDTNSSGNIVVNGKVLKEGDSVTKEQIIGCAGNTGYNTSGAHLHYEVNNQNAAIRSGSNNPFTETINPIYFYMSMDESITKSDRCEAASNGNGFYWYGENE